jgi:hypothetical protein
LRNQINNKFKYSRQKWIYIPIKSKAFSDILDKVTFEIKNQSLTAKEVIELISCFKEKNKAWVKFKSVKGRSNLYCECEVITKTNKKIKTAVSCELVLNGEILNGTPKSLKLYKSKKDKKYTSSAWEKPDDGFVDDISYPAVEDELTEFGYEVYKSWKEEVSASGMTAEEYRLKYYFPHGYTIVKA